MNRNDCQTSISSLIASDEDGIIKSIDSSSNKRPRNAIDRNEEHGISKRGWARSEQKQYSKSKKRYLSDHVVAGAQIVNLGLFIIRFKFI